MKNYKLKAKKPFGHLNQKRVRIPNQCLGIFKQKMTLKYPWLMKKTMRHILEHLQKLSKFHKNGSLTDEEFSKFKEKLIK